MHATWCKSRIPRTKGNSQHFYHYTHTFSIPYNAITLQWKVQSNSRISLKIVMQCCAYVSNDKMHQVAHMYHCYLSPGKSHTHTHTHTPLPFNPILFLCIEWMTSSGTVTCPSGVLTGATLTLSHATGTWQKNHCHQKKIGSGYQTSLTCAARKISITAWEISGPIPSPLMRVTVLIWGG